MQRRTSSTQMISSVLTSRPSQPVLARRLPTNHAWAKRAGFASKRVEVNRCRSHTFRARKTTRNLRPCRPPGSGSSLARQRDLFKSHYRLILLDARGHGGSDKPHEPAAYEPPLFDLQLTEYDDRGWRATFYTTGMEHSPTSAIGTAWEHTPWHATQRAACEVLVTAKSFMRSPDRTTSRRQAG